VVALFILYGAYQGIFRSVGKALASDLVPEHARATGIGLYAITVGLAALIASAVGGQRGCKLVRPRLSCMARSSQPSALCCCWRWCRRMLGVASGAARSRNPAIALATPVVSNAALPGLWSRAALHWSSSRESTRRSCTGLAR
jgi:MFS family permease